MASLTLLLAIDGIQVWGGWSSRNFFVFSVPLLLAIAGIAGSLPPLPSIPWSSRAALGNGGCLEFATQELWHFLVLRPVLGLSNTVHIGASQKKRRWEGQMIWHFFVIWRKSFSLWCASQHNSISIITIIIIIITIIMRGKTGKDQANPVLVPAQWSLKYLKATKTQTTSLRSWVP